jgi:hypothetical protein
MYAAYIGLSMIVVAGSPFSTDRYQLASRTGEHGDDDFTGPLAGC